MTNKSQYPNNKKSPIPFGMDTAYYVNRNRSLLTRPRSHAPAWELRCTL